MTRGKKRSAHLDSKSKVSTSPAASQTPCVNGESLVGLESTDDDKDAASPGLNADLDPSTSEKDCDVDCIDILGNSLLIKRVHAKGIGMETRPKRGDTVTIRFRASLEDGTEVDNVDNLMCVVGDGDVVQALDLALPFAEVNEKFTLDVDPRFGFGDHGRHPDIPSGAKLRYEVELLSVTEPPPYSTMSPAERVAAADAKRERGNYYYRREEYAFAINSYNKALSILCDHPDTMKSWERKHDPYDATDLELIENLETKLYNNLAATQLKIQAYDAAVKSCNSVLFKHPHNFKALFRKGKALLEQGDVDEAITLLRKVHDLVPASPMVAGELQRAHTIQQKERERWSRAANRVFPRQTKPQTRVKSVVSRLCSTLHAHRLLISTAVLLAIISSLFMWFKQMLPFGTVGRFFTS